MNQYLEQRRSVFCVFQYQIYDDYSVSFTALIFSVGIWCPEGDSTHVYCNIIIIP